MLQRREEYLDQVEAITRLLVSQLPDLDALKEQNKNELEAFARYRRARTAFLAALAANERQAA